MTAKMSYREQLLHPNWQRKRLETLDAAKWTCASCGAKEQTLHVHHRRYLKGHMAWEYEEQDLDVLCDQCHKQAHVATECLEYMLTHGDAIRTPTVAIALLAGWLSYDGQIHEETGENAREVSPSGFDMGLIAKALLFYEGPHIAAFLENTPRAVGDPMPTVLLELIERFKAQ